jgi:hypothetical protein
MEQTIRIQSDGNSAGTVVTDANGRVLTGIYSATVTLEAGQVNIVDLVMNNPEMDVHADVREVVFQCPCCDEYVVHRCSDDQG